MPNRHKYLPVALVLLATGTSALATQPSFMGLGDLSGGLYASAAQGISADGQVVVGYSYNRDSTDDDIGFEAFRWTPSTGMVAIGSLPGLPASWAAAISGDGSVIAGLSRASGASVDFKAATWDAGGIHDLETLGPTQGSEWSYAAAVSYDGSVVVGRTSASVGAQAFRWTSGGGMMGLVGAADDPLDSRASGVSADGSIVVGGASFWQGSFSRFMGFMWNEADGIRSIGVPASATYSDVTGVSANGQMLLVSSDGAGPASVVNAYLWTASNGFVNLGSPISNANSVRAFAASADGSVIVGEYTDEHDFAHAFLWDSQHGIRDLQTFLTSELGLTEIDAWGSLAYATAVSADGRTIAGSGYHNGFGEEAWVVTIPEPEALALLLAAPLLFWFKRSRCTLRGLMSPC